MNFILQTIENKITLEICFQIECAKKYWDQQNPNDSFNIIYTDIDTLLYDTHLLKPEEWYPVGTIEFVEKYIRTYFGDEVANRAMKPLNVPQCFLDNKMNTGRYIENAVLSEEYIKNNDGHKYLIKDNDYINNPLNDVMTSQEAMDKGLKNVQISTLIRDGHNSSEWRVFIHNGEAVDIKHYAGDPFAFPDMDAVLNSYIYQLKDSMREGILDVYVDELDEETYVLECHKFFSCGLYGFDNYDILPLILWRTYEDMIKK